MRYKKIIVKDAFESKGTKSHTAIVSHADRYDSERMLEEFWVYQRHVLAIDEYLSMYNVFFHLN